MDQKTDAPSNVGRKYITAAAFVIALIILARLTDITITLVVNQDFPAFSSSLIYVYEVSNALIGIIGTYAVYRILLSIVNSYERHRKEVGSSETVKVILRILFYATVIFLLLATFGSTLGISLSQAFTGGAIGGIVLGLAVQTIATSILSGFLLSSSRTISRGDILIIRSSAWGMDILCRVVRVNILFTEVITQDGNQMRMPNSTLFTSTLFTKINTGDSYLYPIRITINSDVDAAKLQKKAESILKDTLNKETNGPARIYLTAKASGSNTFTVMLNFSDFSATDSIIDTVNKAFDAAYWSLKK